MPSYQPEHWQSRRWQTDSRWYVVELVQDLWGNWQVRRSWGGRFNRIAGEQSKSVSGPEEGAEILQRTAKRRQQRGYKAATTTATPTR